VAILPEESAAGTGGRGADSDDVTQVVDAVGVTVVSTQGAQVLDDALGPEERVGLGEVSPFGNTILFMVHLAGRARRRASIS
jgi:hypothetical protein